MKDHSTDGNCSAARTQYRSTGPEVLRCTFQTPIELIFTPPKILLRVKELTSSLWQYPYKIKLLLRLKKKAFSFNRHQIRQIAAEAMRRARRAAAQRSCKSADCARRQRKPGMLSAGLEPEDADDTIFGSPWGRTGHRTRLRRRRRLWERSVGARRHNTRYV